MRAHAAFTLAILAASCGPAATTPVAKPPTPPAPAKPAAKPTESPARWVLLPSGAVTADARLVIEGVGTLFVGKSGDRWLEKKGVGLVAAETLISEAVRGVVRDGNNYAFVGASGTVFIAKDPLGPVVETRPAKTPLRSVAVGARAILGFANGVLTRSTDLGLTWAPVTTPKVNGALVQLAMLGKEGLALAAPQQVLATDDDGATWQAVASPSIGARRVVADANGDLVLEGLTASAVLRTSPLRLEKVARAPTAGWDLPLAEAHGVLLGSDAVFSGAAALIGDRYIEAVQDQEVSDKWRLAITELGKTPMLRQPPELDHCERVSVTGQGTTIVVGCVNATSVPGATKSKWGPMPAWSAEQLRLFKSTDGGITFKEDGTALASDREKLMWLSPEGVLVVDGACKRAHSDYDCYESPPVVRPPGAKSFAKAVSAPGSRFERVVFAPNNHAYAIGSDNSGRQILYVSSNGGRDFVRRALPPVMDEKGSAHSPLTGGAAIAADEAGAYVVARSDMGKVIRYAANVDGTNAQGTLIDLDIDAVDLSGRRGFAYDVSGKGYETADGGATWKRVAAPAISSSMPSDRYVACSAYGCLIADRATRVGWDLPLGSASGTTEPPAPAKKNVYRTPLKCAAEGEWKPIAGVANGTTSNADLGGGTRWVLAKREPTKGALSAIVATSGPKGLDTKELTLFPAGQVDSAGTVSMQVEGVVALRYNFKRDKSATPPPPPIPKTPIGKPYPYPVAPYYSKFPAITAKQVVDVDIAWYVAATGKVYKGTIKNAGAIDPAKDVIDGRDQPSTARTALLSIAAGGVHVRPFASAGADSPLFFVSESGKVEKLVWPELPSKDVRGRSLTLRVDAARVNNRSIVFGDTGGGLQMYLAWANQGGSAWETRVWGLWPELDDARDAYLRFVDSGDKPILGVIAPGSKDFAGAAFAIPIEGAKSDPDVLGSLPTQKTMSDPPRACTKGAVPPWRITMPYATGTRHPVTVTTDGRDILFATTSQVFRAGGTGEPCVTAIDAQQITAAAVKGGASEYYSVIISPDDLGHASLFRNTWKSGSGSETALRPMSCSFAPGPLPEALANTPGFVE